MNDVAVIDTRTIHKPSKKQKKFIEYWLNPDSDSFGNAYQSALKAKYSDSAARTITGNSKGLQWIKDAKMLLAKGLEPEHIYAGLQAMALKPTAQDRDKIRALELMAKIQGMFIERSQSEVSVTFTNAVPRPIIAVDVTDNPTIKA